MFEVCGIIEFSKITFFNFSASEKRNKIKKIKNYSKPLKFVKKLLNNNYRQFQSKSDIFWFFTEILSLSVPFTRCAGHNTDLRLKSNISKSVNIALTDTFFKEYLIIFLTTSRFINFALVVLWLLMLKICRIIGSSKIAFFKFSGSETIKQNEKKLKTIQKILNFLDLKRLNKIKKN